MIAVISDLHFEEEATDIISAQDGHSALIWRRNLEARAYAGFIAKLADEARSRNARQLDLVIAGDLFDLNRTSLWFHDELRPYVALNQVSPALEAKLLNILNAIAKEPPVRDVLEMLRLLVNGKYLPGEGQEEVDFPAAVRLHYIFGNHDRLINATPAIRKRVQELTGLNANASGDATFAHEILFDDPEVLIRHGHEYDPTNFGLEHNYKPDDIIPVQVAEAGYSNPNMGDAITIDIASRLPYLFRQRYKDAIILNDYVLSSLYKRLLQFDDVRPQSALLDYMLDASEKRFTTEDAWERLSPVLDDLLHALNHNQFFLDCMRRRSALLPRELQAAQRLLEFGYTRNALSREMARKVTPHLMGGATAEPELFALNEELVRNKQVRFVVSGHTHNPKVALIGSDPGVDRFYINTGTWRNTIPSDTTGRIFGQLRALTYVLFFNSAEVKDGDDAQGSFDYWTGLTANWMG